TGSRFLALLPLVFPSSGALIPCGSLAPSAIPQRSRQRHDPRPLELLAGGRARQACLTLQNRRDELSRDIGIELSSGVLADLVQGGLEWKASAMRAARHHGIEGIGHAQDSAPQRYLLALQPGGVTLPVEALVV